MPGNGPLPAPGLGDVVGAAPRDDRADPADPFVEEGRADGGHLEPRVVPAGGVPVAEPGEEPVPADPQRLLGAVVGARDAAIQGGRVRRHHLRHGSPSLAGGPDGRVMRYNEPADTNSSLAHRM